MQQAIPYRTWPTSTAVSSTTASGTSSLASQSGNSSKSVNKSTRVVNDTAKTGNDNSNVVKLVFENAVIVFGRRGCCMCHVVKQLLLGLGANPTIYYVDEQDEAAVTEKLSKIDRKNCVPVQFPAVFVGGKLFGGLERVMATHISGELVPILRQAGALWL